VPGTDVRALVGEKSEAVGDDQGAWRWRRGKTVAILKTNEYNFSVYSAYQVEDVTFENGSQFLEEGKRLEAKNLEQARKSLEAFVGPSGEIDASAVMREWFGGISAEVFISHSRADKDFALTLAGWLSMELNISSFIDSCAWGHANNLLRDIDNAYCRTGESTYSYQKSTVTASHVHLMLSTALSQMIDRSECVFFLKTENSLKSTSVQEMTAENADSVTQSPWLFHELSMLRLIRRREKEEHRTMKLMALKAANFSEARVSPLIINYPIKLDDVPILEADQLNDWRSKKRDSTDQHSLDLLYEVLPPYS